MIQISHEQFEAILPLAVEWAEAKEKVILEHGIALSPQYMEDAKLVGVKYPDVARIKRPMRDVLKGTTLIYCIRVIRRTHHPGFHLNRRMSGWPSKLSYLYNSDELF